MKKNIFLATIIILMAAGKLAAQMENDTIKLKVIEIVETRMYKVPYIANDFGKVQIESYPTRDIGDFLRTVPNVAGVRKGGASIDPVVRGFKFSQLNVIIDNGIKIENGCPNRMDPVTSHLEAENVERMDVIKGPYIMKYGPAIGGVINMITEKPHPYEKFQIHANATFGFETNWDGQKEHLSINGGSKKIYFLIFGGYRDYGNYKSGNLSGHDTTIQSSFRKYNFGAKLGFVPANNHEIMLSYYEVHGQDIMYPSLNMDDSIDNTRIGSIDYSWKNIGKKLLSLDVKIYQTRLHHVMVNSNRPSWKSKRMIADARAINTGGRAETMFRFGKHKLLTGLDYENILKNSERNTLTPFNGEFISKKSSLWIDALIQNIGLYAEYTTYFSKYEVSASLRLDYNNATSSDTLRIPDYFMDNSSQFVNLSLSAGITRIITNWFTVSLSLGRGTRSPNMLERYIKLLAVGFDNYDYLGNPQLKPEINNEADLTVKITRENIGGFYINGFYSYVEHFISGERLPDGVVKPQTMGVLGVKQFKNLNGVNFTGAEFGYTSPEKYKLGGSAIAAYTYGFINKATKYVLEGNKLVGTEEIKNDALNEIPPFETTINVYYKFWKGHIIPKLTCRLVADQRHTSKAYNESYSPGFGILSFSLQGKISKYVKITGGVTNIFDRQYYEHLNRNIVGTTDRLYEPGRVFYINLNVSI